MISESLGAKYHHKQIRLYVSLIIVSVLSACAQVPKESVELSTTVGRDIAEMHRSHKALAIIIYDRIKKDVNRFVDDVYTPYQIGNLLRSDYDDFKSGSEDSLFTVMHKAVRQPDDNQAQKDTLPYMHTFLEIVREEIESFRKDLLDPVIQQEKELLSAIDRSYNQIHYANSIVTGHLASIVKVHDAQDEVLKEFGAEGLYDGPASVKGTYGFQSDYLRRTYSVLAGLPFMNGSIYWALRDFAVSPGWKGGAALPLGYDTDGLNHKGLLAYDGTVKPAWAVAEQLFGQTPSFVR